ncbi:MAG: HepT-like ribonuclease domain-containing protein [Nanoarchaeota archaeon]
MYDKERISIIIEDIKKYSQKLRERNIKKLSDLDDLNFYACSMIIFSILNKTIDLGDEIIDSKKFGFPSEIKDIFILLGENKVINKKTEEKLKDLIRLRNKIAHRYGSINKEDIFKAIEDIKIVEMFVSEVVEYIKKNEK